MIRRIALILSTIVLAFGILFTSVLKSASIKYSFSQPTNNTQNSDPAVLGEQKEIEIDYYLPFPGRILPDHFLWPLKALRDKLWLLVTTDAGKKAELKLLFADKRLAMSKTLFEIDKPEIAFSTLTKAEKYLQEASSQEEKNREEGMKTDEFLLKLAKAALKHRQIMEEILPIAPEDAKPGVIETKNVPIRVFEDKRDALLEQGLTPPQNPFNGT